MFICQNAEGAHGQEKFGNSCLTASLPVGSGQLDMGAPCSLVRRRGWIPRQ